MARRTKRPPVTRTLSLLPQRQQCSACDGRLWRLYQTQRTITTLEDVTRLSVTVVRCPTCAVPILPVRATITPFVLRKRALGHCHMASLVSM